jgi:hypothetical protein
VGNGPASSHHQGRFLNAVEVITCRADHCQPLVTWLDDQPLGTGSDGGGAAGDVDTLATVGSELLPQRQTVACIVPNCCMASPA